MKNIELQILFDFFKTYYGKSTKEILGMDIKLNYKSNFTSFQNLLQVYLRHLIMHEK
jgi:hypothetical protein